MSEERAGTGWRRVINRPGFYIGYGVVFILLGLDRVNMIREGTPYPVWDKFQAAFFFWAGFLAWVVSFSMARGARGDKSKEVGTMRRLKIASMSGVAIAGAVAFGSLVASGWSWRSAASVALASIVIAGIVLWVLFRTFGRSSPRKG